MAGKKAKKGPKKAPAGSVLAAQAVQLYRGGADRGQVAELLGADERDVSAAIDNYLDKRAAELTANRELVAEVDQLEKVIRAVLKKANAGDPAAIDRLLRLQATRRELVARIRPPTTGEAKALAGTDKPEVDPSLWRRQADESAAAYTAFSCYRDAGPARTLLAGWLAYREIKKLKSDRPSPTFRKWAKEHDWEARTLAYDNDVTDALIDGQLVALDAAKAVYRDALVQAAHDMVLMASGIGADHARIAACRDIMDRSGFTRKRAGAAEVAAAAGGVGVEAENAQFNFDLSGLGLNELAQVLTMLAPGD